MSVSYTPVTRHDPTLCSTGRHGCWSCCSCGWLSDVFTTVSGAHLAFGDHLRCVFLLPTVDVVRARLRELDGPTQETP